MHEQGFSRVKGVGVYVGTQPELLSSAGCRRFTVSLIAVIGVETAFKLILWEIPGTGG